MQTLSRLNRAHPQKHDVAVLDFANDADAIERAFADYYRTTVLSEQTDPNRLHDLQVQRDPTAVAPGRDQLPSSRSLLRFHGPTPGRLEG